uniref:Myosin motor domain-containing protein n=1 Tax=Globodera pallida TaxID=36090 RepID=A0A183CQ15_GLOPA
MEEVLHISKGDFLWLDTANHGGNGVAIGARVLSVFCDNRSPVGERRILLMDDDGKKIEVNSADLYRNFNARSMHPTSIQVVEDLLHLREPHEAAIMRNLQIRHREGINYTFIGQRILLALRPVDYKTANSFKQFNALYSSHSPLELPPHIFSIGADLLQKMGKNYWTDEDESTHSLPNNCCVVFSGECGSGKSANTRHLLNFMAENAAGPMMDEKLKAIHLLLDGKIKFGKYRTFFSGKGTNCRHFDLARKSEV